MEKWGFRYNMNTCASCGACQMACKAVNGLQQDENFRRITMLEMGPYSGSCNHCEDAGCVRACPTGAMYKAEDGTTGHDDGKCIGCGACIWNCPYGAVSFSKAKGVSQKCTSCPERRAEGLSPACVAACPTQSLHFEKLEETAAELSFLPDAGLTEPHLFVTPSKRMLEMESEKAAGQGAAATEEKGGDHE